MQSAANVASASQLTVTLIAEPGIAGGPRGAFGSECWPYRLDAYLTHELRACGTQQALFVREESSVTAQFTFALSERARKRATRQRGAFEQAGAYAAQRRSAKPAASTALVVAAYATTWSRSGQRCWTHVGTATILLATLTALGNETAMLQLVQNRDNDASTLISRPLLKGRLFVAHVRASAEMRALRAPSALDDVDQSAEQQERTAVAMSALIDRGMSAYFARDGSATLARPTKPFLMPFHCPEYRTPRMVLPASAYALQAPAQHIDVAYYEQLLDIALARSALQRRDVAELAAAPRASSPSLRRRKSTCPTFSIATSPHSRTATTCSKRTKTLRCAACAAATIARAARSKCTCTCASCAARAATTWSA